MIGQKEVVLITGAAGGLGLELARIYAANDHLVILGDINDQALGEAVSVIENEGGVAFPINLDVTNLDSVKSCRDLVLERFGRVDILINNAGVAGVGAFEFLDEEHWEQMLQVNLLGVIRLVRAFTPSFKEKRSGHILNISSMASIANLPYFTSYSVTKAAVNSLSESLFYELGQFGIKVSVACPSFFKTNFGSNINSKNAELNLLVNDLIDKGTLNAKEVARNIYEGQKSGELFFFTHRESNFVSRIKRFFPRLHYRFVRKVFMEKKGLNKDLLKM